MSCWHLASPAFLLCKRLLAWWRSGWSVELATTRSQLRVPATPLHIMTSGKLLTHMCLCSPSSINWYRRMLGAKQALRVTHWSPCPRTCSFGWCLAEGYRNGDQRRPMGPCGLRRTLALAFKPFITRISFFHNFFMFLLNSRYWIVV